MKMDKKMVIGIIVLVIVLGGVYVTTRSNDADKMTADKKIEADTMAKEEAMKKDNMSKPESEAMTNKDGAAMEGQGEMMAMGGQYASYDASKVAFAKEGKVVLFFNASWCPTCKAVDADIKAHLKDIPKDTLILSVDYDSNKELKAKYGVTTQHTFVQVDAESKSVTQWVGGDTLQNVLSHIK